MLACSLALAAHADWPPPSFTAEYEVLIDGKPRAEARVVFRREGGNWSMENLSQGTRGLARFLGVESIDSASGTWRNGITTPLNFSHQAKVSLKQDRWTAVFDWEAGEAVTNHEEGESRLPLEPGTVDPLSLTLEMQSRLSAGLNAWEIAIVDEDEIEIQRFEAALAAPLQTALGCLEAIEVRRIRDNNKRYSSVWFAPELAMVTVRMIHGKRGGNEFELRLRTLMLDGRTMNAAADCD